MTTMPLIAEEPVLHVDAHADTHQAHHEEEHDRPAINRLGLWVFMASESMLFFAMAAARFYLNGLNGPEVGGVNLGLGVALTLILLTSSWLGYQATGAISKGNRRRAIAALLLIGFIPLVAPFHTMTFSRGQGSGPTVSAELGPLSIAPALALLGAVLLIGIWVPGPLDQLLHSAASVMPR